MQQLAAKTGGRVVAAPGASAAAPHASSAKIFDIHRAKHVLVVGNTDLLDDAPALEAPAEGPNRP